jgi:hypothetical protein
MIVPTVVAAIAMIVTAMPIAMVPRIIAGPDPNVRTRIVIGRTVSVRIISVVVGRPIIPGTVITGTANTNTNADVNARVGLAGEAEDSEERQY